MLDRDSLRGKRIGVMRFASGFGTEAAFEGARGASRARRDPGRHKPPSSGSRNFERASKVGRKEVRVLLTELKADLEPNIWPTSPAPIGGPARSPM